MALKIELVSEIPEEYRLQMEADSIAETDLTGTNTACRSPASETDIAIPWCQESCEQGLKRIATGIGKEDYFIERKDGFIFHITPFSPKIEVETVLQKMFKDSLNSKSNPLDRLEDAITLFHAGERGTAEAALLLLVEDPKISGRDRNEIVERLLDFDEGIVAGVITHIALAVPAIPSHERSLFLQKIQMMEKEFASSLLAHIAEECVQPRRGGWQMATYNSALFLLGELDPAAGSYLGTKLYTRALQRACDTAYFLAAELRDNNVDEMRRLLRNTVLLSGEPPRRLTPVQRKQQRLLDRAYSLTQKINESNVDEMRRTLRQLLLD